MLRIAYYISDYGFGHATRSSAVIQGLLKVLPQVEIVMCNSFAMPFLEQYLCDERVRFRHVTTDLGYFLKKDSLEPDVVRLNTEYNTYMEKWDEKVEKEIRFLQDEKVDIIISDIVPTAFEAGKRAGVPSIGISNFTWYTAYEGLVSEEKLEPFRKAYDAMDTLIALAGENEQSWSGEKYSIGFFSRELDEKEVERIRRTLNPDGEKIIVYFGLGMKITHDALDQFAFWDNRDVIYIVSSNTHIEKENVYRIPPDYLDTHHFIAAADLAITKAGWGTVTEAVVGNTPLLMIDRPTMKEDQNTISFLKERHLCKTISEEELKSLTIDDSLIKELKHPRSDIQKNQLNEVVDKIQEIIQVHMKSKNEEAIMNQPLFLQPVFQERIWGGTALKDQFNYNIPSDITGECWAISGHPNGQSTVINGEFIGKTIGELWNDHRELFGNHSSPVFPLLTKILDANADLSVQVHPNDDYAKEHENGELGKTECWYIIDCDEDAEMIFGHTAQTKEEFVSMIEKGEWNDLLRRIPVKPGDFFYVPSGTIHALCKGTLVLETQQSSDTTYRVYDYDRRDAEGNTRDLHIDKSIEVTTIPHKAEAVEPVVDTREGVESTKYVEAEYFTVYKWNVDGHASFVQDQPFQLASVLDGSGMLKVHGEEYSLTKGDHFILPADIETFEIEGQVELIVSHV